ncbi:MAG: hypothetical protein IPM49_12240 [Flavobacteriales bacterium]|nr:hypothetical protein [Flavobacteriales bacterium]
MLKDTADLLLMLRDAGAEIFRVFSKPFSIDSEALQRLVDAGIDVRGHSYEELEQSEVIPRTLSEAIAASKRDNKKIVVHEVGGYFAPFIAQLSNDDAHHLAGVVEDTTFGHNRYNKCVEGIQCPVFSVARSPLKEIEARFVGDSVATALDQILRDIGVTISGRSALVVGYGMIGKNVASALKARKLTVAVYDKHDHRILNAFSRGYHVHKKRELLMRSDLVVSATGEGAITLEDIEECKNGAILASAGSKDTEFDVRGLRDLAIGTTHVTDHLVQYELPNGKWVYVARQGTAVNFLIESVPDEIIDLVFAEIILCTMLLLKRDEGLDTGRILSLPPTYLNNIAKDWLKDVNR